MKHILAAALCSILAFPLHAGLLDWITGGTAKTVDCAPDNRDCLWHGAVDLVFANAETRDYKPNTNHYARQLTQLDLLRPADTPPLRARLLAADEHESFLSNFDAHMTKNAPPPAVSLADLEQALDKGVVDQGKTWRDVVLAGFTQALAGPEAGQALDLWDKHRNLIWSKAGASYRHIQLWLVAHDLDRFEAYTKSYILRDRHIQSTWRDLTKVAEVQCLKGQTQDGARALTVLFKQYSDYDWEDTVIELYSHAEFFGAVLACRGEQSALQFLDTLDSHVPAMRRYIGQKYPEPSEQAFVLSAAHDTVEIRTTRLMAHWYYNIADDKEKSRAMFERGIATSGVWDVGKDGAEYNGRVAFPFEEFENHTKTVIRTHLVPDIALTHFVTKFEADLTDRYDVEQQLSGFADMIPATWPGPTAQAAITKIMTIANDLAKVDAQSIDVPDLMALRFAALPQPVTCRLPDDVVQAMLDRLPDYRWGDDRVEALTRMVRYLDRIAAPTDASPKATPCALPDLMP